MLNVVAELVSGTFTADQAADVSVKATQTLPTADSHRPLGVVIGRIHGVTESGQPLIALPNFLGGQQLSARSLVQIEVGQIGSDVAVVFPEGEPDRPLVLGVVQGPAPAARSRREQASQTISVQADGERFLLTAEREVVLRCGKASISLTADGNVLIRGAYVLSRASGTNRIRGGNVQIN